MLLTTTTLLWTLVFLTIVLGPRSYDRWCWQRHAATSRTYLLVPAGTRPDDLTAMGAAIEAVTGQLGTTRHAGITIHRYRDDQLVRTAITIYGHPNPDHIAQQTAAALHATAQPADNLTLPTTSVGQSYIRRIDYRGRPGNTDHPNPSGVADWLSAQLVAAGEQVCVSTTFEPAGRWDRRQLRRWHMARAGRSDDMEGVGPGRACKTHTIVFDPDRIHGRRIAGGTTSQLHRWPFNTTARPVTSARTYTAIAIAIGLPGLAATFAAGPAALTGSNPLLALTGPPLLLTIAAGFAIAAITVQLFPTLPHNRRPRWNAQLHTAGQLVAVERTRLASPARTGRSLAGLATPVDHNMQMVGRQRALGYPYGPETLVVNSQQAAQMFALPAADDTGTQRSAAADVGASADIITTGRDTHDADATLIGTDRRGRPVRLPDTDRKHGIFIVGEAGSGKSVAALRLFQQDAAARLNPPRRRDGHSALIWIETKGEGADAAEQALHAVGYQPGQYLRLDVNATVGPRLELLDHDDPTGSADRLVGALTYAFETGSVGPRAAEAMQAAFNLAMRTTPDIAEASGLGQGRPNIVWLAVLLMAADTPNGPKRQLLNTLTFAARQELHRLRNHTTDSDPDLPTPTSNASPAELKEQLRGSTSTDPTMNVGDGHATDADVHTDGTITTGSDLYDALRAWMYYETAFTRSRWAEVFESPRNKLAAVGRTIGLFTPDPARPEVTFRDILNWHGVVILNVGSSPHGRADDLTSRRLAAICLYLLWQDIQRTCVGWLDTGRSINLYADELAALSGTGSGNDVIRELRDLGRAYGVQAVFATQRLDQLPQRTISTARGFGSRLFFQTESIDAALDAVTDLNSGQPDGRWTVDDLRGLDVGQAIARLRVNQQSHPPFILNVHPPDQPTRPALEPATPAALPAPDAETNR